MARWVLFLRGVNVGGSGALPMKELVALIENLGCKNVRTYIQSGNVVFTASGSADDTALADDLEKAIADELGVTCRVVVLTSAELARTVADNPFPDEPDPKRLHAIFLTAPAGTEAQEHLAQVRDKLGGKIGRDEVQIIGRTVYLHTPDGFGRSELAKVLSRPRGPAEGTARNWATVTKLLSMCES